MVRVVPKSNISQRKARLFNIAMKVDAVVAFAWIRRYDESRSNFKIKIRFVGHLFCIAEIMWSILSRKNPYKHGWVA